MKRIFILAVLLVGASLAHAQDIAGDWQGALNTGMGELRLVLHITKAADGALKATLDSVDQGSNGIPVNSISFKNSKLSLGIDAVHGTYEGTVAADGKTISGTWSQGSALALDFKRATAPIKTEHKPAKASDIDGAWSGTLDTGNAKLHVVFHIANTEDGLTATMDSLDQNLHGMPMTSVTRDGTSIKIEARQIGGTFSGKIAADLSSIDGKWSQGGTELPLALKRVKDQAGAEPKPVTPSDIDGAWIGKLDAGGQLLRVVFHIRNAEDGLTATLDSLDQGMRGLPGTAVSRDGSSLKIETKQIDGAFAGQIATDLSSIDGIWTQRGHGLPLTLKRVKDDSELILKRPQNPVKPYPYREEEVSYDNKLQNVTLAATLTIPPGKGPFPGVVLITGSGPQDRDESLLEHKPFLILSDYLSRHGIVVLRADDRGTANSTGNFSTATTADFATDTEAGVAYLKTRAEVNPNKIGLIGHSEGGVIAPMVASRNKDVAFIVMMAGTGVPGDQVLVAQGEAIQVASGMDPEKAAKDAAKEREILILIETEKDDAVLEKKLKEKMADMPEAQRGLQIQQLTSPWFRYFFTYDPATALRKVTCPVLAINGSLDKQILPSQNLPPIRKALEESGNKHFEVTELPGLNHLFQTAKTGSPSEYAGIEETMSPVALDKMATWILKQ